MDARIGHRNNVASAIVILLMSAGAYALSAQPQTKPEPLRFDVASVKLSTEQRYLSTVLDRNTGPHVRWTTQLSYLIQYAYNVPNWQISSPTPLGTIYEIDATTAPNTTEDQLRQMFRSLLSDRLKLAIHHQSKVMDGYAITLGKKNPDLEQATEGTIPSLPAWLPENLRSGDATRLEHTVSATLPTAGVVLIVGRRVTMQQLSERLQISEQMPVVNQTGLAGEFYFAFEYLDRDAPAEADAPSLSDALKHLGLNLERRKEPVDIIVVDHIAKVPTEN